MTTRRIFLSGLLTAACASAIDPEELLWRPRRKIISLPPTRLWLPADSYIRLELPYGNPSWAPQLNIIDGPFFGEGMLDSSIEMIGKIRFTKDGLPIFRNGESYKVGKNGSGAHPKELAISRAWTRHDVFPLQL